MAYVSECAQCGHSLKKRDAVCSWCGTVTPLERWRVALTFIIGLGLLALLSWAAVEKSKSAPPGGTPARSSGR